MSNEQPDNIQPNKVEPDRELLWDFVYDLLDEVEAADVRARISADTDWARAYADVVLQCNELAEAAKVQDGAHDWSAVRDSAQEKTTGAAPINGAAHDRPAATASVPTPHLQQDRWRRRMTRFLSAAAAALLVVSLLSGRRQPPDPLAMISAMPELTISGPVRSTGHVANQWDSERDSGLVDWDGLGDAAPTRFDVDADSKASPMSGIADKRHAADAREVNIRLRTMGGEPLSGAEAKVTLTADDELIQELDVLTDQLGAVRIAYDANQAVKQVNVQYNRFFASLDLDSVVDADESDERQELKRQELKSRQLNELHGEAKTASAVESASDLYAYNMALTDNYQVLDFSIGELMVDKFAKKQLDRSEMSSRIRAARAPELADSLALAEGEGAEDSEGTEGENIRGAQPVAQDKTAPMLGTSTFQRNEPLLADESFIVEAELDDRVVYVLNGLVNDQGVVRAMIPRDLTFSELQLRSRVRPEQRAKWTFEVEGNAERNSAEAAQITPLSVATPAPKVARNWDALEQTYQKQWQDESSTFIDGATRFGVLGLALGAGMLVIVFILYFLRAAGTPACAAATAASIVCLMASVASLQSASNHNARVVNEVALFQTFVSTLERQSPELFAVEKLAAKSVPSSVTWEDVANAWEKKTPTSAATVGKMSQLARARGLGMADAQDVWSDFALERSQLKQVELSAGSDQPVQSLTRQPPLEELKESRKEQYGGRENSGLENRGRQTEVEFRIEDGWLADAELRIGNDLVFTGLGLAETRSAWTLFEAVQSQPMGESSSGWGTDKLSAYGASRSLGRADGLAATEVVSGILAPNGREAVRIDTKELWFVPPYRVAWSRNATSNATMYFANAKPSFDANVDANASANTGPPTPTTTATTKGAVDAYNKTEAGKTDSNRTDSGKTDSGKTDSGKTEAGKTDSNRTEADRTEALFVEVPNPENAERRRRFASLTVFPTRQAILREAARLFDAPSNDEELLVQQHFLRQATADQQQQAQGDLQFGRWAVRRYRDASPESFGLNATELAESKEEPWFVNRYGEAAENLRLWSATDWPKAQPAKKFLGKPHVAVRLADGATIAAVEVEPQGNEPIHLSWPAKEPQDLSISSAGDAVVVRTQLHEVTRFKATDALWGLQFSQPEQATVGDDVTIAAELTAKSAQERVVLEVPLPAGFTPSSESATPYNADSNVLRYYFDAIAPERPGKLELSLQTKEAGNQQAPPASVYSMKERGERQYFLPSFRLQVQPVEPPQKP